MMPFLSSADHFVPLGKPYIVTWYVPRKMPASPYCFGEPLTWNLSSLTHSISSGGPFFEPEAPAGELLPDGLASLPFPLQPMAEAKESSGMRIMRCARIRRGC